MLLVFTLVSFAQNERKSQKRENQFTSEQNAILKTKQMVLQLDLNKFQEDQLLTLNEKREENRQRLMETHQAKKQSDQELSSDEKFSMKNEMLDAQIKYQADIKKVLNEKEFEEWRTTRKRNYSKGKRKLHGEHMQKQKMKNKE